MTGWTVVRSFAPKAFAAQDDHGLPFRPAALRMIAAMMPASNEPANVPSFAPFTGGAPSKASMAMNSSAGGTPATAAGTHKLSDKFASPITNLSRRSWGVGGSLITNHWKSGSSYLCARSAISYGLSTIRLRPAGAGLGQTSQLLRPYGRGLAVGRGLGVGVHLVHGVDVVVGVAVAVAVGVAVGVRVAVGVAVGVAVTIAVAVGVGVGVRVAVAVAVPVGVTIAVGVGVGVRVAVGVAVAVAVGVGVPPPWQNRSAKAVGMPVAS